jgi:hypothetical protein
VDFAPLGIGTSRLPKICRLFASINQFQLPTDLLPKNSKPLEAV